MITNAHPPAQLTVRGWLFLVLLSMGLLVLAGAAAGAALLNRTDEVSRGLTDQIQPARRAALQLQAALRDQETGVRGYAIAADRQFLTPYYDGQHAEQAAAEEARRLLGQRVDLINDLDAVERAAANWRASSAEPLIASVVPTAPTWSTAGWRIGAKPNSTICVHFSKRRIPISPRRPRRLLTN